MRDSASERVLRAVVADLALLDDDDVDAILAELDPPGRVRLLALLRSFRSGPEAPAGAQEATLPVSDWLNRRLATTGTSGLTRRCREGLLRACAEVAPDLSAAPRTTASKPQGLMSLFRVSR